MKLSNNFLWKSLKTTILSAIILFLFLPIIILVIYSFSEKGFPYPIGAATTSWYITLFNETELWISFFNSLFIASITSLICGIMTIFMIIYQFYGGCIKRVVPLFYSNLVIPETILAISLLSLFSFFELKFGLSTIIIAHTILGLGLSIPIIYNRFCDIDKNTIEASYSLGATKRQTFFQNCFTNNASYLNYLIYFYFYSFI